MSSQEDGDSDSGWTEGRIQAVIGNAMPSRSDVVELFNAASQSSKLARQLRAVCEARPNCARRVCGPVTFDHGLTADGKQLMEKLVFQNLAVERGRIGEHFRRRDGRIYAT